MMKSLFKPVLAALFVAALTFFGAGVNAGEPVLDALVSPDAALALGFAGLTVNRANLNDLFRGFKLLFQSAFDGAPSEWNRIAMMVPSVTSEEKYGWLGAVTRFREWLGDRTIQNLMVHDYTIKNKSYENTVGVDRDDIEDDRLGVYSPLFSQLGMDAKQHPDELVFALLAAGFATLGYDGQYFFDTDHPVRGPDGAETSVSNHGGGAGTAWYLVDDTKAIKPLIFQKRKDYNFVAMDQETDEVVFSRKQYRYGVDARCNVGFGLWQLAFGSKQALDVTSYSAAREAMMEFKGDNGKPLGIRPTLLVVPPSLEKEAKDLLEADRLANGASNTYRNTAKLIVTPWLA